MPWVLVESRHRLLSRDAIIAQQVLRLPPPRPNPPSTSPRRLVSKPVPSTHALPPPHLNPPPPSYTLTPHAFPTPYPRQDLVQTTLGKALGMVFCRKALGEGDHVHLSGLGSLFLVIMTAQAVIIGLGWSPETTLRRCRRSTPAAAELEEREQGSQPAKRVEVGGGGRGGPARRARSAPCRSASPAASRRGQVAAPLRPRAPPREGRAVAVSPQRNLLRRLAKPPTPTPTSPYSHRILQVPCCRALMMSLAMLAG